MIGPFSIDTYLPSFPHIEAAFGITRATLSQSIGVYMAAFAISTLFWGPLSDRVGRRPVILFSLLIFMLASLASSMADDIEFFMWMRVLQGLSASGGFIAGRAMIRDAFDSSAAHQAMSRVTLLFSLAPAVAPMLGGWLQELSGWRSIFWFLGVYAVLLIGLIPFIRETLANEDHQSFHPISVLRVYLRALLNRQFLSLALTLGFSFAGLFLYIAGAPTVIYDFLGLGSDDFGLQFIPMVAGMMLGALLSSLMAHRLPIQRTVTIGFVVMALAVLFNLIQANLFTPGIFVIIGPLVIYALGLSIAMPAISIMALDCFPHHRGTASSMQGFLQMSINAAVASIAIPLLHTELKYFVLGQLLFLSVAFFFWLRYRNAFKSENL